MPEIGIITEQGFVGDFIKNQGFKPIIESDKSEDQEEEN